MIIEEFIKNYAAQNGIKNYTLEHELWQSHNFKSPLNLGKGIAFFYYSALQTKANTYKPYETNLRLSNKNKSFDLPFIFENVNETWIARFIAVLTDEIELNLSTGTLTIHPTPIPVFSAGDLHIYTGFLNYYLLTPKESE